MKGSWSVQAWLDHLPPSPRGPETTQLKSEKGGSVQFIGPTVRMDLGLVCFLYLNAGAFIAILLKGLLHQILCALFDLQGLVLLRKGTPTSFLNFSVTP